MINVEILIEFPTPVWRYMVMCLENIGTDSLEKISKDTVFLANCAEFALESDPLAIFGEVVASIAADLISAEQENHRIYLPFSSISFICMILDLNRLRFEFNTTADEEQRRYVLATLDIILDELDTILEQVEASL